MKYYTNEQVKEFIKCPQFGDLHYGKWGSLKLDVRYTIYNLIKLNESLESLYKETYEENERLHNIIKEVREYIENNEHYDMEFKFDYVYSDKVLEILDKGDEKND